MSEQQTYLPAAQVCSRYGVSAMTIWRWLRNKALGFPAPTVINKRRYWDLSRLQAWEASRAAASQDAA
jgi:predicted DNA-binding transcriptional regulator AlpA